MVTLLTLSSRTVFEPNSESSSDGVFTSPDRGASLPKREVTSNIDDNDELLFPALLLEVGSCAVVDFTTSAIAVVELFCNFRFLLPALLPPSGVLLSMGLVVKRFFWFLPFFCFVISEGLIRDGV